MASRSGKVARIKFTSASATTSTGEACTRSTGSTGNGFVAIDSTQKRHWSRTATDPTLYLNSTAVSSTNYDVNYVLGRFEWRTGDPSTGTYTADVRWVTASFLSGGRNWDLTADVEMLDATTLSTSTDDVQWRTFKPGLSQASVNIGRLTQGSTVQEFFDRLNAEQALIVELWNESTSRSKWEGYGWVSSDQFSDQIAQLATEDVTVQIDGQLYYSTV